MKRAGIADAWRHLQEHHRKGVFFVLAIVSMMAAMTFVGMSVDLGMITVTKTRMQSAADAAALGAAQEIVIGIRQAGEQGVTDMAGVQAIAAQAARDMAADICEMNGYIIDTAIDVELGKRVLAEDGISYVETWGAPPYNMVKVQIRKTNPDLTANDGKLPLIFAPVTGERAHAMTADAVAFIESRDIVAVLDYSGSMAFDSQFRWEAINRMGQSAVEDSLDDIWDALVSSDVRFSDETATPKFPASGFGNINSYYGTYVSSNDTDSIFEELDLGGDDDGVRFYDSNGYSNYIMRLGVGTYNLNNMSGDTDDRINSFRVPDGYSVTLWDMANESGWKYGPVTSDVSSMGSYNNDAEWIVITKAGDDDYAVFPQEGKYSSGSLKGKPSRGESEEMWKDYIRFVKNNLNSYGYQKRYGYRTLMHYLITQRMFNSQSEDLWRAPIYPHHAMKEGVTMLTTFLNNLGYGDHLGLVTYASTSKIETGIDDDGADIHIDLGQDYLTEAVMDINTIQRQKQSGHYGHQSTGIGYALEDARALLDAQGRYGAQKAILLITDGQSNQYPSGYGTDSLPHDWNWNDITDFNNDGTGDLVIDNNYDGGGNGDGNWRAALHSFVRAKEAFDAGYTVHTISAGDGADTVLMEAIARMTGGEYVHIPSGATNEEIEINLEAAFAVMAGQVPPARIIVEEE